MKATALLLSIVISVMHVVAAHAAAPYIGKRVSEVLNELRETGVRIAYSSRLVPDSLLVEAEPKPGAAINAVAEILASHGLTLVSDEGLFLVVVAPKQPDVVRISNDVTAAPLSIENITVLASRYQIDGEEPGSRRVVSQSQIESMPDLGDDPIRIAQTLPGTAASGASARTHFRGGNIDEVGIVLNGMRLFDPFHVRDFQNIFSTIDSRAISDVEVFTGGYPTRYGDRLSGMVVMESMQPDAPRLTQIGLSVYNASLLHAVRSENSEWLFSARRGNLDLVINEALGKPSYYDLFSKGKFTISGNASLSVNAIYAEDAVDVVLESEPLERESSTSATRTFQAWAQLEMNWSENLASKTTLSATRFSNRRLAELNDPEKIIARVLDVRNVSEYGLTQDWSYQVSSRHYFQWGFSGFSSSADFDYSANASYFGLPALYEQQEPNVTRVLSTQPDGGRYGMYFSDRWLASESTTVEWGLRWDDQSYNGEGADAQISPRLALLKRLSDDLELRLSWGRYHQSQAIHELQVEDNVSRYHPAQRADHYIASLNYRIGDHFALRLETYVNDIRGLQPRFENLFDPLSIVPELAPDRIRIDASRARNRGVELSVNGHYDAFNWWAAYTRSTAEDRIDGVDTPRSWDQRHAMQAGLSWANDRWDIALAANVHSGWPTTGLQLISDEVSGQSEPELVAIPSQRNAMRLNDFASLNMRVARTFDVRRGRLSAFVEISNLTDRRNVCCIDYDVTDNDDGSLGLESSTDYWLPLLPAIGVLWEF